MEKKSIHTTTSKRKNEPQKQEDQMLIQKALIQLSELNREEEILELN